jgi:hypothetical protein
LQPSLDPALHRFPKPLCQGLLLSLFDLRLTPDDYLCLYDWQQAQISRARIPQEDNFIYLDQERQPISKHSLAEADRLSINEVVRLFRGL